MDQSTIPTPIKKIKEPRHNVRAALILAIFLVVIAFAIWIGKMYSENKRARTTLGAEKKVQTELERCNGLLSQGQGQFTDYEYCKNFVQVFSEFQKK